MYFRGKYSSSSDLLPTPATRSSVTGFRPGALSGSRLFGGGHVANSDRSSSVDIGKAADYFFSARDISASSDSAMGGSIATASSVTNSPLLLRSN